MTLPRRQTSAISGNVQREALILGQILRVLVAQDVEALGVGLHQSVLDAVMHHLDEVPGAGRSGVNVAALGAGIALLAARRAGDIAEPRRERREDRIEVIHGLLWAADHHAIAALDTPDAAGRAAIDVANALLGQFLGAADVVLVEGIAAIDDDVVRLQQAAEMLDRFFGDPAGWQHHPNGARLFFERLDHTRPATAPPWRPPSPAPRAAWHWRRTPRSGVPPSSGGETMLPPMRPRPITPICICVTPLKIALFERRRRLREQAPPIPHRHL